MIKIIQVKGICYKTKEPIYYNKETKYESSKDTFLYCLFNGTEQEWHNKVEELNNKKNNNIDIPKDWEDIDYFYTEMVDTWDD